ncbi:RagB/SusD family nutrient uptake outer membrane protein [Parabacteroides bouchesdurhonensis]|uniref:RagB/SusD family nutrient uptake outer membrane protein n=1 Tax=Parabacteroides bouchesdurhonensis TaxID=1936995 RepID=UPI000E552A44|nr:RagB/SusD family nutrient uptake outer membrane protein [Parabacteroides bouchesdurhonensis]RHJ94022.1 RagB/SusD family nutrient uptake outer membrane protein [Bacteroides sp. AM07-16]
MKSIINFGKVCIMTLFASILMVSCNSDFLDRPTLGSVDEATYLNSENGGFKLLIGCYEPINDHWNYQQMKFDVGDQLTDDCSKGGSDAADRVVVTEVTRGNPTTTSSMLRDLWKHRYESAISACNVFLSLVTPETQLIKDGGALVTTAEKQRWIAEARFLRAFYYFDLAMIFANVPIIDTPLTSADKGSITKSDKEEVRKFILADLDAAIAEANLPGASAIPESDFGRVSKEAAMAFRARVKMFFGDYEGAKTDLKAVVDGGQFDLISDYQTLFNSAANGYMSKEAVFITTRAYIPNYTGGSVVPQMCIGRNTTGGWGGECPTNNLTAEYEVGDPRLVHTVMSSGDIFYKGDGVTTELHDYSGYDNFPQQHNRKLWIDYSRRPTGGLMDTDWSFYHIRYADVLLMYAECLIETGGDKQLAVDLINKVRYRAFVTTSPKDQFAQYRKFNVADDKKVTEAVFNANYKVKVSDDLRKAVRHERRVELAGEGLRLYDLLRWGTFVSTMQAFSKTTEAQYSGAGSNVTDKTWPYPIPQTEIDNVGGALTQNDNYK